MENDAVDVGQVDWEKERFGMVDESTIFWLKPRVGHLEPSFRKLDDNHAMNLRSRATILLQYDSTIYLKEY
jgi:hypothetical protein